MADSWEARTILTIITIAVYLSVKHQIESQPQLDLHKRILKTAYHGILIQMNSTQQQYTQNQYHPLSYRALTDFCFKRDILMLHQQQRINNYISVYQDTKDKNDIFTKLIQKNFYDADPLRTGKTEPVIIIPHFYYTKLTLIHLFKFRRNSFQCHINNCYFPMNNHIPGMEQFFKFSSSVSNLQNYLKKNNAKHLFTQKSFKFVLFIKLLSQSLADPTECNQFFEEASEMTFLAELSRNNIKYEVVTNVQNKQIKTQLNTLIREWENMQQKLIKQTNYPIIYEKYIYHRSIIILNWQQFSNLGLTFTSIKPPQIFYHQLLIIKQCKLSLEQSSDCFNQPGNYIQYTWTLHEFGQYLLKKKHITSIVWVYEDFKEQLEKMIYHSLMSTWNLLYQDDPRNKELIGINFTLDSDFQIWFQGSHEEPHYLQNMDSKTQESIENFYLDYIHFLAEIQRIRYNWLRNFLLEKVKNEFEGKSQFITLNTWDEYNDFVGTNPNFEEGNRFRKLQSNYGFD